MAYEICPECGAEKHQLMKCPQCGFQRSRRTIKPGETIPIIPKGTAGEQRTTKSTARNPSAPVKRKRKGGKSSGYSKKELEAEIARLERFIEEANAADLKQFAALRTRLDGLKRERIHRISGYRRRMVRFFSGGSPGLKR